MSEYDGVRPTLGEAVVGLLHKSGELMDAFAAVAPKVEALTELAGRQRDALRAAPMPFHESTLEIDAWLEAYSDWWHASASDEALG